MAARIQGPSGGASGRGSAGASARCRCRPLRLVLPVVVCRLPFAVGARLEEGGGLSTRRFVSFSGLIASGHVNNLEGMPVVVVRHCPGTVSCSIWQRLEGPARGQCTLRTILLPPGLASRRVPHRSRCQAGTTPQAAVKT
ncbi:hypothetical protein BN1708_007063 [Verticillium longisporum]|uniref:Uncharacterized protein n=1 Tax=Verticillium longisporum TaxID=100787 RepID=A0A0G4MQN3_VERLO|nr:hypothetical protein BN1708_007063 [Verticillium longisporum]